MIARQYRGSRRCQLAITRSTTNETPKLGESDISNLESWVISEIRSTPTSMLSNSSEPSYLENGAAWLNKILLKPLLPQVEVRQS